MEHVQVSLTLIIRLPYRVALRQRNSRPDALGREIQISTRLSGRQCYDLTRAELGALQDCSKHELPIEVEIGCPMFAGTDTEGDRALIRTNLICSSKSVSSSGDLAINARPSA